MMSEQRNLNSGKLAKNTMALYIRMLFSMAVGLYTSRVVLNILGVSDFGIYNVVGSIVTLFSFINGSMSLATSRFLTVEIGKEDKQGYKTNFRVSLLLHVVIAVAIFVITEIVGLWFLYEKMVIPPERIVAAFWVFQFSLLACIVSVIYVPYTSAIIAFERMSIYAWFTIIDVSLKLIMVFLLYLVPYDKLIVYAIMMFVTTLPSQLFVYYYCLKKIEFSQFVPQWDRQKFREMFSFAGWTIMGQVASIGFTQGLNMLLNVFFGPAINAARGIAVQVQAVVYRFITNFQTAINPQITKTYASNQMEDMHKLIILSSKFSFYLLLIISTPVLIETHYILELWLGIVPESTADFFRIIMLVSFVDTLANPLIISNMATGKVKTWNIICGSILLLILPISYICLKIGLPAVSVFFVHFLCACAAQVFRLVFLKKSIGLSIKEYISKVIIPSIMVFCTTLLAGIFISSRFSSHGFVQFVFISISTCFVCVIIIFAIGLSQRERSFMIKKASSINSIIRSNGHE